MARPALTFFLAQVFAAILIRMGHASLPPGMLWLVGIPALALGALLTGLEILVHHDELGETLRSMHIEPLLGAFGSFTVSLLLTTLGAPVDPVASTTELATTTQLVAGSAIGAGQQVAVIGAAVGLNLGLAWIRSEVLELVSTANLDGIWARLESGGVLVALLALALFPLLALVGLVLLSLLLTALGLALRVGRKALDRRERVPCGACQHPIRPEASLCPQCKSPCTPKVRLDEEGPVWERLRALRPAPSPKIS